MKPEQETKILDKRFRHVVRRTYLRLNSLSDKECEEKRKWILKKLHDSQADNECMAFVNGLFDALKISHGYKAVAEQKTEEINDRSKVD